MTVQELDNLSDLLYRFWEYQLRYEELDEATATVLRYVGQQAMYQRLAPFGTLDIERPSYLRLLGGGSDKPGT